MLEARRRRTRCAQRVPPVWRYAWRKPTWLSPPRPVHQRIQPLGVEFMTPLDEGMVLTIEPGLYRAGLGGIRLEDDVLVTAQGPAVLSALPLELQELPTEGGTT